MDFSTFVPDILSNLVSALVVSAVAVWVWPSRYQILASFRTGLRIHGVWLYLSFDGEYWNLEVPKRFVNDVRWRLRRYRLTPTNEITSMEADEHSDAFRLRIAAYDQSYADDVPEIRADLAKHRIVIEVVDDDRLAGHPAVTVEP